MPEQKSVARIDKHLWNVHQFYIDMLDRFIALALKYKQQLNDNSGAVKELESYIDVLKTENKNLLGAGREKIKDYEIMILNTRRQSSESIVK